MANRIFNKKQALEKEVKDLYGSITFGASTAATATLTLTNSITLTSVAAGDTRNTTTFRLVTNAAAANPTNTVLATFSGTSAAIVLTITPNNGTNNGAVPVNITTAQVAELINNGTVAGKTITLTDASSLRALQTATGGGAQNIVNGGEGSNVTGTFANGAVANPALASTKSGIASIVRNSVGVYTVTLSDVYFSLKTFKAILFLSSGADVRFNLRSNSITSKSFQFQALTGASVVDPSSSAKALLKIEVKNSKV